MWYSFKMQWKNKWVTILIDVGIAFAILYLGYSLNTSLHDEDVKQRTTPLFKYVYDQTNKIIGVNPGDDFSPVAITWMIPEIDTLTSTGFIKNSLSIEEDVIEKVIFGNLAYITKKFGNPIEGDFNSYFECIVLNQFGLEASQTLEGFPIGVKIDYIVRGDPNIKSNYDLILLRSFDINPIQVHVFPNLREAQLKNVLFEKGNQKFNQIIERTFYDKNHPYIDGNGNCSQFTEPFLKIPLK